MDVKWWNSAQLVAQNVGLEREYMKIMKCEKIQTFNNYYIYDRVRDKNLDGKVESKS